jgi:ankyrin repeat protein
MRSVPRTHVYPQELLNLAARSGHASMCRTFSDAVFWDESENDDGNVDLTFPSSDEALQHAARGGSVDCCKLFLRYVDEPDMEGAVRAAASNGHADACMLLLGAVFAHTSPLRHMMEHAMYHGVLYNHLNVCRAVFAKTKELCLNTNTVDNRRLMVIAAHHGYNDICRFFCLRGIPPCTDKSAALVAAALRGDAALCSFLCDKTRFERLAAKAHVSHSWSLCCAAERGHTAVCELLVSLGAVPTARSSRALAVAAQSGHTDTCKALLKAGARSEDLVLLREDIYKLLVASKRRRVV